MRCPHCEGGVRPHGPGAGCGWAVCPTCEVVYDAGGVRQMPLEKGPKGRGR